MKAKYTCDPGTHTNTNESRWNVLKKSLPRRTMTQNQERMSTTVILQSRPIVS